MNDKLKHIFRSPYFILLLMVVAANWQLVFLQSGLEWDMMNFWMPWRYFMSECYNNGIVPLWDPYTQSGYPVHGDLQGPAYSPEAILVSFLFGQNIYILNYCFVFYLYVAAVGMFKLALFFTRKKEVSVLAGIIYSMSGFNIAHGHYFYIMVSVALVPLIFYYFFRILEGGGYLNSLKLSLIIFWHITTGNPSFLIIAGYLMAGAFFLYTLWKLKQGQGTILLRIGKKFGVVALLSLLMALPVIYNAMQIIPLTTRKSGLDLAYAGDESFYLKNFIAFVIPLITITNTDLAGHAEKFWSPYVGAFTLFFFVFAFFGRKSFFEWLLVFIGVVGLLVALGLQGPAYPFLHKYLPFFNVFRMPNLSLLFFLILVIILSAKFLSDQERMNQLFSRNVHWYLAAAWLLMIGAMLYTARYHEQDPPPLFSNYNGLRQWIYDAKPSQIAYFHLILFLVTILVLFIGKLTLKNKTRVIMLAMIFDVFVNYQLGGVARIFSVESPKEMNSYFSRFPKGFAVPEKISTERVSAISAQWPGYWLNTSIFNKQPDFPNSNNFELTNYLDLLLNKPKLSKNIFKNSYAFFADSLAKEENFADSLLITQKSTITLRGATIQKLNSHNFSNSKNKCETLEFFPNGMTYSVHNEQPAAFVITQNYCPLWRFTLNGKPYKPAISCSGSFPVFLLPAGTWEIRSEYILPKFRTILFFSLILFGIGLFIVVWKAIPAGRLRVTVLTCIPLIFIFCFLKFYLADPSKAAEKTKDICSGYLMENKEVLIVNNTSFDLKGTLQTNFIRNEDLSRLQNALDSLKGNEMKLLQYDRYLSKEAEELIHVSFGERTKQEKLHRATISTYQRSDKSKLLKDTNVVLDQLINDKNPYSGGVMIDSIHAKDLRPGDVFVVSAMIQGSYFDFPGLSFEVHYASDKPATEYRYAGSSFIKYSGEAGPSLVYKLPEHDGAIKKIVAYVWNPSVTATRVRNVKMRIYRP